MLKIFLAVLFPISMFFGTGLERGSWTQPTGRGRENDTVTLEKMIVANGSSTIDLNLGGLGNRRSPKSTNPLRFDAELDSFFTVLVFNNELRGAEPSSMNLLPQASVTLPGQLN